MNLIKTCPNIPDDWEGGISDVAKILGLDADTVAKYAKRGKYRGGLEWKPSRNGRKRFTGSEVKRFWREY